jgi:hypothetical protein
LASGVGHFIGLAIRGNIANFAKNAVFSSKTTAQTNTSLKWNNKSEKNVALLQKIIYIYNCRAVSPKNNEVKMEQTIDGELKLQNDRKQAALESTLTQEEVDIVANKAVRLLENITAMQGLSMDVLGKFSKSSYEEYRNVQNAYRAEYDELENKYEVLFFFFYSYFDQQDYAIAKWKSMADNFERGSESPFDLIKVEKDEYLFALQLLKWYESRIIGGLT